MCCSSKRKQTNQQIQTNNLAQGYENQDKSQSQAQPNNSYFNFSNSSRLPKSRLNFGANDFDGIPFSDGHVYAYTQKHVKKQEDIVDRLENYNVQNNRLLQSRLLMPKQILSYQLDHKGGITQIPVLNTFHYQTSLHHYFSDKALQNQLANQQMNSSQMSGFNKIQTKLRQSFTNQTNLNTFDRTSFNQESTSRQNNRMLEKRDSSIHV